MSKPIMFSLDEDFDELSDKDQTVELIGYVDEIFATQEVGQKMKYKLFKFTLNNNSNKRITCLIWGADLIKEHESLITINRILHIDGGHCKAIQLSFQKEAQKYVPFEIVIQKNTVMNDLGIHQIQEETMTQEPKEVKFDEISEAEGLIKITGFVKTKFAQTPSRYEAMSYGYGSITDGHYKLTVHVSNYTPVNIEKGVAVSITGEINAKAGPFTITCKDVSQIVRLMDVAKMTPEELMRGVKTPKRKAAHAS